MKKKNLAKQAGISFATITKMGKEGTVVTTDVLARICTALNCDISDMIGDGIVAVERNNKNRIYKLNL